MSDIDELERRLTSALDRIGAGLAALSAHGPVSDQSTAEEGAAPAPADTTAPADHGEAAQLAEALAAEREANEQLEERVKAIRERQERHVTKLEQEVAQLRGELTAQAGVLQKLRRVNTQLRDNNKALRDANAGGLPDPHLINKSMLAELDALRTSREADRAEMDDILGALKPLIAPAAPQGGADA